MKKGFLNSLRLLTAALAGILAAGQVNGQPLAFPGAEGFGKYTTGGRGGEVIEVTNLNDHGTGSLRSAILTSGARTVVFRVSGTIYLESTLSIKNGNITIAGQTAPGDGITLANYNFRVSTNNVIIRYIRSRLGDEEGQEEDAFTCTDRSDVIVDHCSFSWSVDEAASCYDNEDFTMQWCIMSESLFNSIHSKGEHGYGGIWGGNRASFHHNLFAHHTSRNPRFDGARGKAFPWEEIVDYRNNVIYNWGFNSVYAGEPSEIDGTKANINIVGNYYKSGPGTNTSEVQYRVLEPYKQGSYEYSLFYIDSNYLYGYPFATADNWQYGVQNVTASEKEDMKVSVPFEFDADTTYAAEDAYVQVLQNAGATLPRRDTLDKRIIWEVINDTALFGGPTWGANTGIIDSQDDVGGWPALFTGPAPADNDHDGMADEWELANGLDPGNYNDRNGDPDTDGYTNLEEYLAEIVQYRDFIYQPTGFDVELADITDIMLTWTDNSDMEQGYYIERKTTSAYTIIDTVPQNTEAYTDSGLNYETVYYYRIRAFNETDTSVYSPSRSTTTLSETGYPLQAEDPEPADYATGVSNSPLLSWKKGVGATSHVLYLGINSPPAFADSLTETSYKAEGLMPGFLYFWRVDEINDYGTTQGEIWRFTTRPAVDEKIVGHWQFESEEIAFDSSEFANHGEYVNMDAGSFIEDGAVGKALNFNGVNQYVRVPHSYAFDFETGDFTVAFWMKQDMSQVDIDKEYRYVIKGSHVEDSELGRTGRRYEVYYKPSYQAVRFAIDDNMIKSRVEADEDLFITGRWVHVAAIRDTEADLIRLYANAEPVVSGEDNTGDISQGEDLYFGYSIDSDGYLAGALDDIRLYNYVLSDEEIEYLYHLGPFTGDVGRSAGSGADWSIYPNPSTGTLCLDYDLDGHSRFTVRIYSTSGSLMRIIHKDDPSLTGTIKVDIEGLKPGAYVIQMEREDKVHYKKLLIKQ
jgi:pectate lyase